MKHAREDYNRIQDPEGKIPWEEPVFLLRGQDANAPQVVRYWAEVAAHNGALPDIVAAAHWQADQMEKWQQEHIVKIPDL